MTGRRKILVTGATSQVARPVAEAFAQSDEVWCAGRFGDARLRGELEAIGVRTCAWDMLSDDAEGLPRDFTHVFHAAIIRDADPLTAMRLNSIGTARLMNHCRAAEAFAFISTAAVYRFAGVAHDYAEHDPLGGHTPLAPSYGPSKIAVEGVVHGLSQLLGLKSVVVRLNTSYGPHGHGGGPIRLFERLLKGEDIPLSPDDWCCPIHTDDIVRMLPGLWGQAAVDCATINLGGDEKVSIGQMMEGVAALTGVAIRFAPTDIAGSMLATDNRLRRSLLGDCEVDLQRGVAEALVARGHRLRAP